MSTIKSSTEHLTLNADGAGKDIKFQANGVEKASISSAGAFTSTSIDATKLSGALPAIDGSALTNLPGGGKVLQVVQAVKTNAASSSATSYTDIGDLVVSITPSSTSSKIMVSTDITVGTNTNTYATARFTRNGTAIGLGDVDGNRGQGSFSLAGDSHEYTKADTRSMAYLDSPASTSALTYKVQCKMNSGQFVMFNVPGENYNDSNTVVCISTITVMEIGA